MQPTPNYFSLQATANKGLDKLGITPVNVVTKNVNFCYELIVRDKERLAFEKAITSGRTAMQKVASTTMVSR